MSAIAHLPGSAWAATHRAFALLVLTTLLLAVAVTTAVLLLTGEEAATGSPGPMESWTDTCVGAPVGSAC